MKRKNNRLGGDKRRKKDTERRKKGVAGARIRVSFSVVVMAAIAIATGHMRETLSYAAAVIFHEFSHASIASRLGYTLTSLKIMPYGAALTGEFETAKCRDEFLIAIAGPLSNIIFAVVFIALWWLVPSLFYYTEIYVSANLFTALVNMLPVFPLDGGRAALALLSVKVPRTKAYKVMRIAGGIIGVVGIVFAIVMFKALNFSYFTFLVFVLFSSLFPDKSAKYQRLFGMAHRMEKIRAGLPVREIIIHKDASLMACSKLMGANYYARFTLTNDRLESVATLGESELEELLARRPPDESVGVALEKRGKI